MINSLNDYTTLNNGVKMPWFGLGVWKATNGEEVISAVKHAIQTGYRSIDTAALYGNEQGVGQAIKDSGVSREELFITTKVGNNNQGYDSTLAAFEESRKKLDLDYIDLYLIHWPVKGKYKETWKALEKLYKEGLVKSIGVSNFNISHLKDLLKDNEIVPVVNQVEFHPLLNQQDLLKFCRNNKIQIEAWSPLMQGNLDIPLLEEIAQKYNKTAAQIVLRWDLQHEIVTIPKSVHFERIDENAGVFDFELSDRDMREINSLNENKRFGPDPINF